MTAADPKLYLSRYTNDKGKLVWTVIYQSQPMMADTENKAQADQVLHKTEQSTKQKASPEFWDGDLGKFSRI